MSERCERTSERMSEWQITNILILRSSESLCLCHPLPLPPSSTSAIHVTVNPFPHHPIPLAFLEIKNVHFRVIKTDGPTDKWTPTQSCEHASNSKSQYLPTNYATDALNLKHLSLDMIFTTTSLKF